MRSASGVKADVRTILRTAKKNRYGQLPESKTQPTTSHRTKAGPISAGDVIAKILQERHPSEITSLTITSAHAISNAPVI